MKPLTISLSFLALFLIADFITSWIRHWPSNRTPGTGTQHIPIIGLLFQVGLLGAAITFLIRSIINALP